MPPALAEIRVARGGQLDVFFNLLTQAGGSLTDDDDWVNGATAGEWPEIIVATQGGSPVDVTADVAKDITADTIGDATHKHPDGETGIWRAGQGQYAFRAMPSTALALGNYDFTIRYDVNGQLYTETHTLVVIEAGDVEIGGTSVYVTAAEVLANFEIADIVTSTEVDLARQTADRMVNAYLEAEGIDAPVDIRNGGPGASAIKTAAIAFARAELRRLKAVGTGMATGLSGLRRITEGDVTYDFVSGDSQFKALHEEGAYWMELAIKALLGTVFFRVGTIGRPAGGR